MKSARPGVHLPSRWSPGLLFLLQVSVNPWTSGVRSRAGGESWIIERILDAYRNGDEDKRLGLFLGFRELRDEFSRIEQDIEAAHSLIMKRSEMAETDNRLSLDHR